MYKMQLILAKVIDMIQSKNIYIRQNVLMKLF